MILCFYKVLWSVRIVTVEVTFSVNFALFLKPRTQHQNFRENQFLNPPPQNNIYRPKQCYRICCHWAKAFHHCEKNCISYFLIYILSGTYIYSTLISWDQFSYINIRANLTPNPSNNCVQLALIYFSQIPKKY